MTTIARYKHSFFGMKLSESGGYIRTGAFYKEQNKFVTNTTLLDDKRVKLEFQLVKALRTVKMYQENKNKEVLKSIPTEIIIKELMKRIGLK